MAGMLAYDGRMLNRVSHTQLLRYAGLFTWGMVGVALSLYAWLPVETDAEGGLSTAPGPAMTEVAIAYLAFGRR